MTVSYELQPQNVNAYATVDWMKAFSGEKLTVTEVSYDK
jgi:hypothetical protein